MLELMETQNQVRLETLFPAFCFQGFLLFSYVDGVGGMLPCPQAQAYGNQWYQIGYKLCLLV